MGSPGHYSVELPERCLKLLDELWPQVQGIYPNHGEHLGPLTATFLLSMAIPIINLPIERIERHRSSTFDNYADDRGIDDAVVGRVDQCLGGQKICDAPFFDPNVWSYHRQEPANGINIRSGLPNKIADVLGQKDAYTRASELQGSHWSSILRNSLAHGGIVYLDEQGRTARDKPARSFAFVNGRYNWDKHGRRAELSGIDVLRVSMLHFRHFLVNWVVWLNDGDIREYRHALVADHFDSEPGI